MPHVQMVVCFIWCITNMSVCRMCAQIAIWAKNTTPLHKYVTYIHTYACTCVHALHTYIHTYIHAYIHTCIHACMHACMHPELTCF